MLYLSSGSNKPCVAVETMSPVPHLSYQSIAMESEQVLHNPHPMKYAKLPCCMHSSLESRLSPLANLARVQIPTARSKSHKTLTRVKTHHRHRSHVFKLDVTALFHATLTQLAVYGAARLCSHKGAFDNASLCPHSHPCLVPGVGHPKEKLE